MKKEKERKMLTALEYFPTTIFGGWPLPLFFPLVPYFQTTSREEVGAKKLIRLTAASISISN